MELDFSDATTVATMERVEGNEIDLQKGQSSRREEEDDVEGVEQHRAILRECAFDSDHDLHLVACWRPWPGEQLL